MNETQQLRQLLKEACEHIQGIALMHVLNDSDRRAEVIHEALEFNDRALPYATLTVTHPPFPSNWAIQRTPQNAKILNEYFNSQYGTDYFYDDYIFHNTDDRNTQLIGKLMPGYVLITDEQFVKNVLYNDQD